mmetsp:Transcript_36/g.60  ORF Transcript_36/g.60 Transcript_36/m.60 type:complete len:361 (-) Transcript_36:79-1161(-)
MIMVALGINGNSIIMSIMFATTMLRGSAVAFVVPRSIITSSSPSSSSAIRIQQQYRNISFFHVTPVLSAMKRRYDWKRRASLDQELAKAKDFDLLTEKTEWNIPGLKKETERNVMRCFKKVQKASERLNNALKIVAELTADEDASLEDLEKCPDVDSIQAEVDTLKDRLMKLNKLEELVQPLKKSNKVLPDNIRSLAIELGVNDAPPPRPKRGAPKPKGPKSKDKSRLPYRRFYSVDGTEIRVGKQATDNDQLSCNPKYRDGSDWWMHAAGCPGSHVVIRCGDQVLNEELVIDAAALAARHSKCATATIKVSLTRCRDVVKPTGAKAGLVQLKGNVRTVSVKMKDADERLTRLDETMLLN